MKLTTYLISLFLLFAGISNAFAQQGKTDPFHDKDGNTYHQLFLDFHVKEIVEIKYSDDIPVDAELSVDGFSIIIKNYPGDISVKMTLLDDLGASREVIKSRCFIDPVLLQL